jgi:hypothetical protein
MDRKSLIEINIEKSVLRRKIEREVGRRDDYIAEYDQLIEILNNRISTNPNRDPWLIAESAVDLLVKIESVEDLIKKYKKDLEAL